MVIGIERRGRRGVGLGLRLQQRLADERNDWGEKGRNVGVLRVGDWASQNLDGQPLLVGIRGRKMVLQRLHDVRDAERLKHGGGSRRSAAEKQVLADAVGPGERGERGEGGVVGEKKGVFGYQLRIWLGDVRDQRSA